MVWIGWIRRAGRPWQPVIRAHDAEKARLLLQAFAGTGRKLLLAEGQLPWRLGEPRGTR